MNIFVAGKKLLAKRLCHLLYYSTVRTGESRDFMAIALYDGLIRVIMSLGAESLVLTMSRGVRLDDGEWHVLEVRQELKVRYMLSVG